MLVANSHTTMGSMTDYDEAWSDGALRQLADERRPETLPRREKWCGCKDGRGDPDKCRKYGGRARQGTGKDALLALATLLVAVVVYAVIPSWKVAAVIVGASVLVNLTAPLAVSAAMAPAHLAASVYVAACAFRKYAGLGTSAARVAAVACLCALALSASQCGRKDRDRDW